MQPKVLTLYDSDPYRRGLAHGEELKEGIRAILEGWRAHCSRTSLLKGLAGAVKYAATTRLFASSYARHIPSEFRQEMRGIATGAGCTEREIVFINCFDDGYRVFMQRNPVACSSFAVRDSLGIRLAAVNLDEGIAEEAMTQQVCAIIYAYKNDGPKVMSIMAPGYIGVLRGINDQGVFLAHHTSHVPDATRPRLPFGLLMRQALSTPSMHTAACTIMDSRPRGIGSNIMLGDEHGVLVLETAPTTMTSRTTKGHLVCTNHFLSDQMHPQYRQEYSILGFGHPHWLLTRSYSEMRYRRLEELVKDAGGMTVPEAFACLAQVANDMTVQSVVFTPGSRTAHIAVPRSGLPPAPRDCDIFPVGFHGGA